MYHPNNISSEFSYERHSPELEYANRQQELNILDPKDGKRRIDIHFKKGFAEL
ncbi:MAG: hypothetical protein QXU18_06460 [Thermoplasmatales archaeon]